jgi:hypothetical protein
MAGMKRLLQSVLLLAQDGEGTDRSFWWVIGAAIAIIALCSLILSIMNKGRKTNSLWKDENSEMDSSSDPASMG